MQISSKYKIYIKSNQIIDNFPYRIKYFHHTKWKRFLIQNRSKVRRYKFKNFSCRSFSKGKRKFIQMKKYYRDCLLKRIHLQQIYNNSFNLKILRRDLFDVKNLSYVTLLKLFLIKHLFFLNILLWKLHFFSSTSEASNYINSNFVFVNKKATCSNYLLKVGDIITFKESLLLNFKTNLYKYKFFPCFYSFIEIDYYTCTIVVVKNHESFISDDYSMILSKPINVSSVYNSIK